MLRRIGAELQSPAQRPSSYCGTVECGERVRRSVRRELVFAAELRERASPNGNVNSAPVNPFLRCRRSP